MIDQLRYFFKKIKNRYDRIKCDSDQLKNLKKSLVNYSLFSKQYDNSLQAQESIILCFGSSLNSKEQWSHILAKKIKTQVYSFVEQNTCNMEIASNIIKNCTIYKPKIIFVNFANLLNVPDFTQEGLSVINYKQILEYCNSSLLPLNLAGRQYVKEYFEINILLKFIQIYKLIETYCKLHQIQFFWNSQSPFLKALTISDIQHYFNTNTFIGKNTTASLQLSEQQIAEQFAKLYYESNTLYSENK